MKFDDHFLAWVLIYSILVYIINLLLGLFNITPNFLVLLFAGFIIALGSWIFHSALYRNKFRLDSWFLLWIVTHSLIYGIIALVLSFIKIENQFIYYLLFGLIYHLITWVIKYKIYGEFRVKHRKTKMILIAIALIICLFFFSSLDMNSNIQTSTSNPSSSSSILSNIKGIFSGIGSISGCPQLDYSMEDNTDQYRSSNKYLPDKVYGDWIVTSENYLTQVSNPLYSVVNEISGGRSMYKITCSKGDEKGENPNYWYCGETFIPYGSAEYLGSGGYAVIIKNQKNQDGTIGDTIVKTFVNVYDEDENFVKTICGKDPDTLREQAFKEAMREIDNFFSLD